MIPNLPKIRISLLLLLIIYFAHLCATANPIDTQRAVDSAHVNDVNGVNWSTTFPASDKTKILIFVKLIKVGGTTVAGVIRRIGAHHNMAGVTNMHPHLSGDMGFCDVNHHPKPSQREGFVRTRTG